MGELPEEVDLAVVGGGVGGYVAAIHGAQLGLSVVLIEKEKLGGHCLNYACIPSKTLIHIADLYYQAQHATKFGISGKLSIDAAAMYGWRNQVSKKLEDGVSFLCKANGIDVLKGTATFLSSEKLQISNGVSISFKKAVIATGSDPTAMKGFEFGGNIIDYKQALMLQKIPESLAIIGAGYVGVELATMYAKLGTKVTIIARTDILSRFDKDAVAIVKKRMQELGVKILTNATPVSHTANSITLDNGDKIESEIILVAVGLVPYTQSLGLENTKVQLDQKGFAKVDNALRTTDQNILAVGDVIGEPMLAHKAIRQGIIAAEVAAGKSSSYDNLVVPSVIFSDPEIALAGSVEETQDIQVAKFPLTALGRSIALDTTNGFVKIAADKLGIVRGVEIVSQDANAMIAEAVLAIEMGARLEDIADTIHPHPTYSEAVQEAAETALGYPIHFFTGKKSKPEQQ